MNSPEKILAVGRFVIIATAQQQFSIKKTSDMGNYPSEKVWETAIGLDSSFRRADCQQCDQMSFFENRTNCRPAHFL
jgi:hypothetical protein